MLANKYLFFIGGGQRMKYKMIPIFELILEYFFQLGFFFMVVEPFEKAFRAIFFSDSRNSLNNSRVIDILITFMWFVIFPINTESVDFHSFILLIY